MLRKLVGLFMVASLDSSLGVIIAFLLSVVFHLQPDLLVYSAGALIALGLDISIPIYAFLPQKVKEQWKLASHRQLTHHPALVLPLVFIALYPFSHFWAWLATLCLTAHLIDDTFDPGGIAWFSPFSSKRFQILAPEREPLGMFEWIEQTYLRPSFKSVATIIGLIASIAIIILTLASAD